LFIVALVLGLAAPVLDLVGALETFVPLDARLGKALGFVLYGLGVVGTLVAQGAMGRSWRIGVDDSEKTELVVTGPSALVRSPIFAAIIPGFLGLTAYGAKRCRSSRLRGAHSCFVVAG
jgi:protein-S-isoprenylcysteine O-methyltransferase Ste14